MGIQEAISDSVIASFPTEREARAIMRALTDGPRPVSDLWIAHENRFRHLSAVKKSAGRKATFVDALFSTADVAAGGALIGLAGALLSIQFGWVSADRIAFAVVAWVFGGIAIGSLVGGAFAMIKTTELADSHEDVAEIRFLLMATSREDAKRARAQLDFQVDATASLGP